MRQTCTPSQTVLLRQEAMRATLAQMVVVAMLRRVLQDAVAMNSMRAVVSTSPTSLRSMRSAVEAGWHIVPGRPSGA